MEKVERWGWIDGGRRSVGAGAHGKAGGWRNVVPHGWAGHWSSGIVPWQDVQLTGVGPLLRGADQSVADRVASDIVPLGGKILSPPQLAVPHIILPDRLFVGPRPASGNPGFPESRPAPERHLRVAGSTEQMKMIREEDVGPHDPGSRLHPAPEQEFVSSVASEDRTPIVGGGGHEEDPRLVPGPHRGMMRRPTALG